MNNRENLPIAEAYPIGSVWNHNTYGAERFTVVGHEVPNDVILTYDDSSDPTVHHNWPRGALDSWGTLVDSAPSDSSEHPPVGTIVRVVTDAGTCASGAPWSGHQFSIGELVRRTVPTLDHSGGGEMAYEHLDGHDYWYLGVDDFETYLPLPDSDVLAVQQECLNLRRELDDLNQQLAAGDDAYRVLKGSANDEVTRLLALTDTLREEGRLLSARSDDLRMTVDYALELMTTNQKLRLKGFMDGLQKS